MDQIESLRQKLLRASTVYERIFILDQHPKVQALLERPSFFCTFLHGLTPECECAFKQLAAIGQVIDPMVDSAERWRELLNRLLAIDHFYREIGGIVGYQAEVLKQIGQANSQQWHRYHAPVFDDISRETPEVLEAIQWGLEGLPEMAEMYPLGGAADRLHLVDEETGAELPAAKLCFAGRTLLEGLIRDVQAREHLYYRRFGKQTTTPIAVMTSWEKENHRHVTQIFEERGWFGRPKESIRFFIQPLVPAVDERGNWHTTGALKLLMKPGGHGALWKLASDEGIFHWFQSLGKRKVLVRQINNPIAGLDYGLLAFSGIGCKRDMLFGFASCPRLIKAAEGMNVLAEKASGEMALTNIEYCDFARCGIEDAPLKEGEPYSRFSSNTNILFADLTAVQAAVHKNPFPGLLINLKKGSFVDEQGAPKEAMVGRLESTMQNMADVFEEPKNEQLKTARTFVTYNHRHKTISVAKKVYSPNGHLIETPEQCFYELLQAARELLAECGISLPAARSVADCLKEGPDCLFLYHPALGPLYSLIRQKIQGGALHIGSELQCEIAELFVARLSVDGSLQIKADQVMGALDSDGILRYSEKVGRCVLQDVSVRNRGVDWSASAPFWKMNLRRFETVEIHLRGWSEFIATGVHFEGSHRFEVEDGLRMIVKQKDGKLEICKEQIEVTNPLSK